MIAFNFDLFDYYFGHIINSPIHDIKILNEWHCLSLQWAIDANSLRNRLDVFEIEFLSHVSSDWRICLLWNCLRGFWSLSSFWLISLAFGIDLRVFYFTVLPNTLPNIVWWLIYFMSKHVRAWIFMFARWVIAGRTFCLSEAYNSLKQRMHELVKYRRAFLIRSSQNPMQKA